MAEPTTTRRAVKTVPLDEFTPHPENPKAHDIDAIVASIRRFGFADPVVVDQRTGLTVSGHGRIEALQTMRDRGDPPPDGVEGWKVPTYVGWASADDDGARGMIVALNRLTETGGWDDQALAGLLDQLATVDNGLDGIGFDGDAVDDLRARLDAIAEPESDHGPKSGRYITPDDPITRAGDVWQIGPHRVMCGDSRDPDDVATLVDGESMNIAMTSPPYADRRSYDESSGFMPIPPDEYVEWFAPIAENVAAHLADDGSWFVNIKPGVDPKTHGTETYVMDLVLAHEREWGWIFATEFCWERVGVPKQAVTRFKNQFEPVYQFTRGRWKFRPDNVRHASDNVPKAAGPGVGDTNWALAQGGNGPMFGRDKVVPGGYSGNMSAVQGVSVTPGEVIGPGLAYPGNRLPPMMHDHEAVGHTAAFPVGLPEFFIRAYTDDGDRVLDPFLGSGSTVIAAHRADRVGYGMEMSPAYVDVALARIELRTGLVPERDGTAQSFAHLVTDDG